MIYRSCKPNLQNQNQNPNKSTMSVPSNQGPGEGYNPNNFSNKSTVPPPTNERFPFKPAIAPGFWTTYKVPVMLTVGGLVAYSLYNQRYRKSNYYPYGTDSYDTRVYNQINRSAENVGTELRDTGRSIQREAQNVGREVKHEAKSIGREVGMFIL
jgi:hypothetical protein